MKDATNNAASYSVNLDWEGYQQKKTSLESVQSTHQNSLRYSESLILRMTSPLKISHVQGVLGTPKWKKATIDLRSMQLLLLN